MGIILVLGYFLNKKEYAEETASKPKTVVWGAVLGVVLGAVVANLLPWGIPSINGMVVAAICYIIGWKMTKK